ncbi:MAG: NfeD family protein [Acidimicrobiales bacterium]
MRSLPKARILLATVVLVLGVTLAGASSAGAQDPPAGGIVDVIQVSGYIDPIVAGFIDSAISDAESTGAAAIVLQLDSPGSVVSEARLARLVERIANPHGTTVAVWVGPSGSQAAGGSARLVLAARHAGLAPGSKVEVNGQRLSADEALDQHRVDIGATCDRERGSTEGCAATIGDFIVSLPEVPKATVERDGETRLEPVGQTRFAQLSLVDRLMHTVASPPTAYLLVVIGMALLVFELFTAGVGVAGIVGAGALLLGSYGLAVLPTRPWAVALLVVAMVGYGIDMQTGVPRVWTGIATVAFTVGSLALYDGLSLSWITLLAGIVGMTLAMLGGMPAMVRTRFSTPTIGREWMVGEHGEARSSVDPDGTVIVRGAPWRARTNRSTPIAAGDEVRVAGIEGLILEVEPLQGAARDHRR